MYIDHTWVTYLYCDCKGDEREVRICNVSLPLDDDPTSVSHNDLSASLGWVDGDDRSRTFLLFFVFSLQDCIWKPAAALVGLHQQLVDYKYRIMCTLVFFTYVIRFTKLRVLYSRVRERWMSMNVLTLHNISPFYQIFGAIVESYGTLSICSHSSQRRFRGMWKFLYSVMSRFCTLWMFWKVRTVNTIFYKGLSLDEVDDDSLRLGTKNSTFWFFSSALVGSWLKESRLCKI